jgi:hypothetical protein
MTRAHLPDRRASETFDLEHAGLRYVITFSRFADGRPAECFVQNHKTSSAAHVIARDSGILLSLLWQFGCPIEVVAHAVTRDGDGKASGVIGAIVDRILTLNNEAAS